MWREEFGGAEDRDIERLLAVEEGSEGSTRRGCDDNVIGSIVLSPVM